jgi:uncharacterized protein
VYDFYDQEGIRMNPIPVAAAGAAGLRLMQGQELRIFDIEGGQTGDLLAFSADGRQRISNGHSFNYNRKIYLSTNDAIFSDRSQKMLSIVADEAGRHDFLYAPCSQAMYEIEYGASTPQPNCDENLRSVLSTLDIFPDSLPTAFNLFMHADVLGSGELVIRPSRNSAGASLTLRAEMDLLIAISSCPAATCNGGGAPKPLAYQVMES